MLGLLSRQEGWGVGLKVEWISTAKFAQAILGHLSVLRDSNEIIKCKVRSGVLIMEGQVED